MAWDHRSYGSKSDPIRQSDLGSIAAAYSCPKKFAYQKADTDRPRSSRAYSAQVIGTAVHEVIHRVLSQYEPEAGLPRVPPPEHIERALRQEIEREADGREIVWAPRTSLDSELAAGVTMVTGALERLHRDALKILIHEAAFAVEISSGDGKKEPYWLTGTVDLVYVDRAGRLILADWKTGARVPSQIVLDHGYQLAIYAHALAEGVFFPATTREAVEAALAGSDWAEFAGRGLRVGDYPDDLYLVYLRDCLPYQKTSTKTVARPEEAAFWGVSVGDKVTSKAGDPKGPAWYRGVRTEREVSRLKVSLKTIVGTVRLGRFVEHLGEPCEKCPYTSVCLNEGYSPVEGDDAKQLEKALKGIDFDGLSDFEDAAQ